MSKSRCDLPLISIGALIAINQNNLLQATVCLEQLILNLPEKKLIEELDSLFLLVNNKSKFFSAIPTKYQAKLLIAAIKMKSQNIVELLLNEKLLAAMISDEFSAMTAMLFKYQLHHLAEFSIQIRKNYASKSIENELATLILLLQIENFSEKYTAIRSLHQLGISPMKKFVKNNQTYTLALTAMSSADKKLISFYLAPEFLTTYSDKEISLFIY